MPPKFLHTKCPSSGLHVHYEDIGKFSYEDSTAIKVRLILFLLYGEVYSYSESDSVRLPTRNSKSLKLIKKRQIANKQTSFKAIISLGTWFAYNGTLTIQLHKIH